MNFNIPWGSIREFPSHSLLNHFSLSFVINVGNGSDRRERPPRKRKRPSSCPAMVAGCTCPLSQGRAALLARMWATLLLASGSTPVWRLAWWFPEFLGACTPQLKAQLFWKDTE